ncbi:KRFJ protein, partial [Todus mexicanus]|nr:KRFJ protein [Todus mexicanus]NWI71598.1 KRFJ protein [Todus mexicanus]
RCMPLCEVTCPEPYSCSSSLGPCVATCGDSTAVVYPPPVVLTFPGVTMETCPQQSIVGTSLPQSSSISGGSYRMGGSRGMSGMGGYSGSGGSYSSGGSFG